ncbi:MAG TPA: 3-dehydroquinate synthase II, partial [Thermoplasmata archaeon]|nr:3-dehydroquinate synthase II [Thermoplasmata archaeon]
MSRERIVLLLRADAPEERAALVDRGLRRGFGAFAADRPDALPPGSGTAGFVVEPERIRSPDAGRPPQPIVRIDGPDDLPPAIEAGRRAGGVAVRWTRERIIPLENLLASAHGDFPVSVVVDRLADVPAMLGALEHGADRLFVEVRSPDEIDRLEGLLDRVAIDRVPWELVPLVRLAPAGIGDRVIVDTTSLLRPAEGMLVGSAAAFLVHVASEATGSRFTRPRPFRVNAGAAHSYALLADGTTRYLAELGAGDAVLVGEPNGPLRPVRVGRIKIERRPLALLEVEREGRRYTL